MGKRKKISLWLAGFLLLLLIIFPFVFPYLAPRVLNSAAIKATLEDLISRQVGAKVEFRYLTLSVFPLPHALIRQGTWAHADAQGSVESLAIYPKLLPLLKARLQISKVQLSTPEVSINLPAGYLASLLDTAPLTLNEVRAKLNAAVNAIAGVVPAVDTEIDDGTFILSEAGAPPVEFREVDSVIRFRSRRVEWNLTGRSNFAERVRLRLNVDPTTLNGAGTVELAGTAARFFTDRIRPDAPFRMSGTMHRLSLFFRADGIDDLRAEIIATLPHLTVPGGQRSVEIEGGSLEGSIAAKNGALLVDLEKLDLEEPRLYLSGKLSMEENTATTQVTLHARDLDVAAIRTEALALAGDYPDIRDIFQVVRGGTFPVLNMASHGNTLEALTYGENLVLRGSIRDAEIFIPEARLALDKVKGDFVVSKGLLDGRNAEANLHNIRATRGSVRVGLTGPDAALQVDAQVASELAGVLSLLPQLVHDQAFLRQIRRVHDAKGTVRGTLTIGERLNAVDVNVEIPDTNVSFQHPWLFHPLQIKGGRFSYTANSVQVRNMFGRMGKSSFSDLTASLTMEGEGRLAVDSGRTSLALAEIYPWLLSFEALAPYGKKAASVQGSLTLSEVHLKGPLPNLANWDFQIQGTASDLILNTSSLPGPLRINRGSFDAAPGMIVIKEAQTRLADARLQVSGSVTDYLNAAKVDASLEGALGPKANQWISDLIGLPQRFYLQAPLSVSSSRVTWKIGGAASVAGELIVNSGPRVALNIVHTPQSLSIRRLEVQDNESHATLELGLRQREIAVKFSGRLTHGTAEKILIRSPLTGEWVAGDFHALVNLDKPLNSTLQGHIEGKEIFFPYLFKVPVTINGFSLDASGKEVVIKSTDISWGDIDAALAGSLRTANETFLLDLDLQVDRLNWAAINKAFLADGKTKEDEGERFLSDVPIRGTVRVKSNAFSFDEALTWNPFNVDIALSQNQIELTVTRADFCGVSFPGTVKITPQGLAMEFNPSAENQDVESTLSCLGEKQRRASGKFKLKGKITGTGRGKDLADSIRGDLEVVLNDGRFYEYSVLAKVLAIVNVTEIFRGEIPDITKEGFGYRSISAKGNLRGTKIILTEALADGSSVDIVGRGEIDLLNQTLDLQLFVAPFKTLNLITERTPFIKNILGGKLVSIPVKVKGTFGNPTVSKSPP